MTNPILGYDIDGQPLRAGDRVEPTDPDDAKACGHPGWPWTVSGASSRIGGVTIEERGENGRLLGSMCDKLRKLPPKQDHEPGSWEEMAKLGWKPSLAPSTADC